MKSQTWNKNWRYRRQGDAAWQNVILPHDAMIHDQRDPASPGKDANAWFVGGIYEYEKRFTAPSDWAEKHVEVEFGGVYRNSKVYCNGVLVAAAFPQAEERKIRILKENGYNAVRISHHPASDALLAACDKLGMYVMDEAYDMWYKPKNPYDYINHDLIYA